MTLLSDLVIETQRRALSGLREETNVLGANISSSGTTISLGSGQTLGGIQPGAVVEVDYELLFVLSASSPSAIGVSRGYYDTVAADHDAGTLLKVNPRFTAVDVVRAINEDIDDLSSPGNGLFQVQELSVTYNPVYVGYDLTDVDSGQPVDPAMLLDIFEVRTHDYGPFQAWPVIPPSAYKLQRNADTSVFPSGLALELHHAAYVGRPLRILYRSAYTTPLVSPGDDVQGVTGLHPQAHDIPTLGAAYRLMQFRELKRSFTEAQGEPRRAQEVPVGASLTAMKGIQQHRLDRIAAERVRLNRQFRQQWR